MSNPPLAHGRRRPAILAVTAAFAVVTGAGANWFLTRADAQRLFEQGLAAAVRDATAGERLLRRATQAAGGDFPNAQIALCHTLARQGLWDDALSLFATLNTPACRADLLLAFGRDALQAGHRPAGLRALQAASQHDSWASVAALELLMPEYQEWGQYEEEVAAARALTRLEPDDPRRWKRLVATLQTSRQAAETATAVREALRHDPPESYRRDFEYVLAAHLIAFGEIAEARRKISDLKAVEGPSFRLSACEIEMDRMEGRFDRALEQAKALAAHAEDLPALYQIRGVAHLDLEQYEQAVRHLERAVAAQPHNERAHFWLAEAQRGLGRDESAGRHAKISAEITARRKQINDALMQRSRDPYDLLTYERLASLHEELGEGAAAQDWRLRARRISQLRPQPQVPSGKFAR